MTLKELNLLKTGDNIRYLYDTEPKVIIEVLYSKEFNKTYILATSFVSYLDREIDNLLGSDVDDG
jgi:hypothetical protein